MSEPYVGEIRMFAGNFAPRSWALCDGQLISISQNDALFSLLGTTYGGDGRSTFGLPDMRGRIPLHQGNGPGLSDRRIGSKSGTETETLTANHLPSHNHAFNGSSNTADAGYPAAAVVADTASANLYYNHDANDPLDPDLEPNVSFPDDTLSETGGNQAHSNVMPFQCINFIIALFGIYPSRN